jgi:hypothetical protein
MELTMAKTKTKTTAVPATIPTKSVYDIIHNGYYEASKYFARYRSVSDIRDGVKPVYRRVLISAYEICPKSFIKTATLIGHTMGHYHPHGDSSIADVITELVRFGALIGDGAFGDKYLNGISAGAANPRYTEVKLNPYYTALFDRILKYVPKIEGEIDNKEYEYLPVPLPLLLVKGSFALSPGLSVQLPAFSMKSLLEAYRKDDPSLLKSTYGYNISDRNGALDAIWRTGRSSIYYSMNLYKTNLGGIRGCMIEGSAELYKPDLKRIHVLRKQGLVRITPVSDYKLFIGINPGVRTVSVDDLYSILKPAVICRKLSYIQTIVNNVVRPIGLKTWVDTTYKNCHALLSKYKSERINAINHKIDIMKNFSKVADYIIDHMRDKNLTVDMISKATGVSIDIVKDIDSMTVNKLRNTDVKKELVKLNAELALVNKFSEVKVMEDFIDKVDYSKSFDNQLSITDSDLDSASSDEPEDFDSIDEEFLDENNQTDEETGLDD